MDDDKNRRLTELTQRNAFLEDLNIDLKKKKLDELLKRIKEKPDNFILTFYDDKKVGRDWVSFKLDKYTKGKE